MFYQNIEKECISLADYVNGLPGVVVLDTTSGNSFVRYKLSFTSKSITSIFPLLKAIDQDASWCLSVHYLHDKLQENAYFLLKGDFNKTCGNELVKKINGNK